MSINADIDIAITITDHEYDDRALEWTRDNNFFLKLSENRCYRISFSHECSYLDSAFAGFIDMMTESKLPPSAWRAELMWYSEEGATEDGGTYKITIENGRITHFQKSYLSFADAKPWDELVESAAKLNEIRQTGASSPSTFVDLFNLCLSVCLAAHKTQTDKNGEPYWSHPVRVAMNVCDYLPDDANETIKTQARCVALLHDAIEDTDETKTSLANKGVPKDILDMVELLTHSKNEPYLEYVLRIAKSNEVVRAIKLSDINDNFDPSRLSRLDEATQTRLKTKYSQTLDILEADSPETVFAKLMRGKE